MRVMTREQVTIPQQIKDKLGIMHSTKIDFVEENGRIYLAKKSQTNTKTNKFRPFRGVATVKMTTNEIMSLTRGDE